MTKSCVHVKEIFEKLIELFNDALRDDEIKASKDDENRVYKNQFNKFQTYAIIRYFCSINFSLKTEVNKLSDHVPCNYEYKGNYHNHIENLFHKIALLI